jgi:hypothetical protein
VERPASAAVPAAAPVADLDAEEEEDSLPPSPMSLQDGIRAVQQAFGGPTPPRFPMYVRQAKQFLRNAIEGFDERKYGFASVVDLLRAAGKEGVVRIERDRQGAVRVFPGTNLVPRVVLPQPDVEDELGDDDIGNRAVGDEGRAVEAQAVNGELGDGETVDEPPILEAETVEAAAESDADDDGQPPGQPHEVPAARKSVRRRKTAAGRSTARASASKPARAPRSRKSTRSA